MHIKLSQRTKDFLYVWWNRFMFLEIVLYFTPCTLAWPLDFKLGLFGGFTQYLYYPWLLLAKLLYGEKNSISTLDPSDDTQFEYFHWITSVVLFAVIAFIWAWLQRKDQHYKFDSTLVWVWKNALRIELAILMLLYGMVKLIPAQMVVPSPDVQAMRIGSQSGFDYLWNFMSFSPAFQCIIGICEFLAGILLLIPRTAIIGGYVSLAVMIPTALMNFFYGIWITIFSTQICMGEITLLWPSIISLGKYLLFYKALPARIPQRIIRTNKLWLRRSIITVYILAAALFTLGYTQMSWQQYRGEQLNKQIALNGRWRIISAVVHDHRFDPLDIPLWSELDFTAANNPELTCMFRLTCMFKILGSVHWVFNPTVYDSKHIVLPTQGTKVLPFDTDINYHVSGDILTLSSQSLDRHEPAFIITAKRDPWLHYPGQIYILRPAIYTKPRTKH